MVCHSETDRPVFARSSPALSPDPGTALARCRLAQASARCGTIRSSMTTTEKLDQRIAVREQELADLREEEAGGAPRDCCEAAQYLPAAAVQFRPRQPLCGGGQRARGPRPVSARRPRIPQPAVQRAPSPTRVVGCPLTITSDYGLSMLGMVSPASRANMLYSAQHCTR